MNPPTIPNQRVPRGQPATLIFDNVDENGERAPAGGVVTIGVTKADGTVVVAPGTATAAPTPSTVGRSIYTLAASSNLTLETLTATWTVATVGSTHTTTIEVCGGFICTIADLRKTEDTLVDTGEYPNDVLQRAILEAEAELEWICDVAFVPRYRRATIDGDGSAGLNLPDNQLRRIRSVRSHSDATSYTAFTAGELAAIRVSQDRSIERLVGGFDLGVGNIVVEYEHGYDAPPADLRRQFQKRARWWANQARSGLPDRTTSFISENGVAFRLDTASPYTTGMPDVDAAYGRYSRRSQTGASVPASRPLNIDPSRGSLFHGGRR